MRFLTAGESHGPQLTAIIEGIPSGFSINIDEINHILAKRQAGYGRGNRMKIESDTINIKSGLRFGKTTGAPITLVIENKDFQNWSKIMSSSNIKDNSEIKRVKQPRPGHADLNGGIKYNQRDLRNILERSSARETAIRVAIGATARQLLSYFNVKLFSHVTNIGGINSSTYNEITKNETLDNFNKRIQQSNLRCFDENQERQMLDKIKEAKNSGDTLGGIVEVIVIGLPIGLGSHVHWDRKLDGRLAQAILSIQAFKGVELGIGFDAANLPGSMIHDEILWDNKQGFYRLTNNAGGIEGGISNGMPVVIKGVMKPIPTLYKPLKSVNIDSKEQYQASIERSDTCAVPAASIVAENVVAWEIANAFLEKFSGDSILEIEKQYKNYLKMVKDY